MPFLALAKPKHVRSVAFIIIFEKKRGINFTSLCNRTVNRTNVFVVRSWHCASLRFSYRSLDTMTMCYYYFLIKIIVGLFSFRQLSPVNCLLHSMNIQRFNTIFLLADQTLQIVFLNLPQSARLRLHNSTSREMCAFCLNNNY